MLPSRSGILAKAIKKCIHLSTTSAVYVSLFVIEMPAFHKQSCGVVLKSFAEFTGVSFGTGVSCGFCDILKNTFFRRTPQVAVSGICSNRDFLFSYCM